MSDTSTRRRRRRPAWVEEGYVSLTDAARYFAGIDPRTLAKLFAHAEVPLIQIAGRRCVKVADVVQLEAALRLR